VSAWLLSRTFLDTQRELPASQLDCYDALMWIDEGHVTPIGNQVIAESMLDVIQARSSDEQ
jgi:hypothetical protein